MISKEIVPWWPFPTEAKFTTAYLKWLKDQWHWCYKISDQSQWQKPFDWFGVNLYVEAKIIEKKIFKWNQMRPHQITALRRIKKEWWKALIQIYSKELNRWGFWDISILDWVDIDTFTMDITK